METNANISSLPIRGFFPLIVIMLFSSCFSSNRSAPHQDVNAEDTLHFKSVDTTVSRIGLKMNKRGGVYELPCVVNGVKMDFIFDTGASNVCLSYTEALFMYKNGYLAKEDFIGESYSRIADGRIVEDMEIILKTVEIGGIVLDNVSATITKSLDAPLLLGLSAIQKLGKVEFVGDSLFITTRKRVANKAITQVPPTESIEQTTQQSVLDQITGLLGLSKAKKVEKKLLEAQNAQKNGMEELAIKLCEEAIELRKKDFRPYAVKGTMIFNDKEYYNECIQVLTEYRELNKKQESFSIGKKNYHWKTLMCYLAASMVMTDYDIDGALTLAQEVLTQYPDYDFAMNILSFAYTKKGNFKMAEQWANKLLNVDKNRGLFRLAYLYDYQGRKYDAISKYKELLENDPDYTDAIVNLGNIYMDFFSEQWTDDGQYIAPKDNEFFLETVRLYRKAARLGEESVQAWLIKRGLDW